MSGRGLPPTVLQPGHGVQRPDQQVAGRVGEDLVQLGVSGPLRLDPGGPAHPVQQGLQLRAPLAGSRPPVSPPPAAAAAVVVFVVLLAPASIPVSDTSCPLYSSVYSVSSKSKAFLWCSQLRTVCMI